MEDRDLLLVISDRLELLHGSRAGIDVNGRGVLCRSKLVAEIQFCP